MRFRQAKEICAFALALALALGCAGKPKLSESYRAISSEARKRLFLALYPGLNPDQRAALLDETLHPWELIEEWQTQSPLLHRALRADGSLERIELSATRENYQIREIQIVPEQELKTPLREGRSLRFQAWALYADGRRVEVTQDVKWSVTPQALAKMDGSELQWDCVASPLLVSANFLGERIGTKTIDIQKPIRTLEVRLAPGSVGATDTDFASFEAIAQCIDGTRSNVSCEADWAGQSPEGEFSACGRFRYRAERKDDRESAWISARYGQHVTRQPLRLPMRRPAGGFGAQ